MNAGIDTSGSRAHEVDRRYLRWLREASASELRAMVATHHRTQVPRWEVIALGRELSRRNAWTP